MAFVQASANNNGAGATTLVITLAGGSASGNGLVLMLGPRQALTISSVSDNINGSTGWVIPTFNTTNAPANAIPTGAYNLSPSAGVTTITVNLSASGVAGGCVVEETQLGSFIGANKDANGGGSPTASFTSGTVTLPGSGNIVGFGFDSAGSAGISYTAGAGWTALTGTNLTAGANTNATDSDTVFFERGTFVGSGQNQAATGTNTSITHNSGVLFFNVSGGGGGTPAKSTKLGMKLSMGL